MYISQFQRLQSQPKSLRQYQKQVQNIIINDNKDEESQANFSGIQTPGWTSVVNTQESKQFNTFQKYKNKYHKNILQKLNSMPPLDIQNDCFKKIRLSNLTNQNNKRFLNIADYEKQKKLKCNEQVKHQIKNGNIDNNLSQKKQKIKQNKYDFQNYTKNTKITRSNSVGKFYTISQKQKKKKIQFTSECKQHQIKNSRLHKRFRSISVHQHLFQNSKRIQSKKTIQKIIDQKYRKQLIFKFSPAISQKSNFLAESKYSKKEQNTQITISRCFNSLKPVIKSQTYRKKNKQQLQKQVIEQVFAYLSQNQKKIQEITIDIEVRMYKMPLTCIKILTPLIQQIYQGKSLGLKQFMQYFYLNNGEKKRPIFVQQIQKWTKLQKIDKFQCFKQNNVNQANIIFNQIK